MYIVKKLTLLPSFTSNLQNSHPKNPEIRITIDVRALPYATGEA